MAVTTLVSHRQWPGEPEPAVRVGDLLMRDVNYPRHAGVRRYFWLLSYGVQLVYEPFGWSNEWYIDVVTFRHGRIDGTESVEVTDQMIDIVVQGNGPTYRILDLHELADAMSSEHMTPADAGHALRMTHHFLEAFLHRGAPFPPPQLTRWFSADHVYPSLPQV